MESKFDKVIILGQMTFKNYNACFWRMSGLAKMLLPLCKKILLIGFDDGSSGNAFGFDFISFKKPKKILEWVKFSFFYKYIINSFGKLTSNSLVIVNSSIPSFVAKKIFKKLKKNNVKFVFDVDEWYSYRKNPSPKNIVKNLDIFYQNNFLMKKDFNFIVSTRFLGCHCNKAKNIFVFPAIVWNKIDIENINLNNKCINITFAGKIPKHSDEKENLYPVIQAIKKINKETGNSFKLNIIGNSGENSEDITYLGELNYQKCVSILASSTFSIIPRRATRKNNAGFPTKLSESFLYSVPSISTKTSNISDYIINGKNGFLLDSNDENEFYKVFKQIYLLSKEDNDYFSALKKETKNNNHLKLDHFEEGFKNFICNI